eukprot:795679-Amphidinium_carterae.1
MAMPWFCPKFDWLKGTSQNLSDLCEALTRKLGEGPGNISFGGKSHATYSAVACLARSSFKAGGSRSWIFEICMLTLAHKLLPAGAQFPLHTHTHTHAIGKAPTSGMRLWNMLPTAQLLYVEAMP